MQTSEQDSTLDIFTNADDISFMGRGIFWYKQITELFIVDLLKNSAFGKSIFPICMSTSTYVAFNCQLLSFAAFARLCNV